KESDSISSLSWHPEGVILASCASDLDLWDISLGKIVKSLDHGSFVNTISFNHDGSLLASAGENATIKLWDWREGNL
ncbi:WD40 repeat domain-containing protein, partial [Klebsiella pneumoniae]|uniref:WD40 repeat domain-containing protein n=1 Tax=Klebsiella pneumoniae TaxID=573 RepID=UPI003851FDD5